MTKVLITYDLDRPGQDYPRLYREIEAQGEARHFMQNAWLVKTTRTCGQIRDALGSVTDQSSKIFVCAIADWGSFNIGEAGNWLKV